MKKMRKILKEDGIKNEADLNDIYTWDDARKEVPEPVYSEKYQNSGQFERISKKIEEYDRACKALTGRTPERIEEEDGIKKEWAFPDEAKILYVGDPWQRMGKEIDKGNLTIIDYEYGEVASFITDEIYDPHEAHSLVMKKVDNQKDE